MAEQLAFTASDIAAARATARTEAAFSALVEAHYGVIAATNHLVGRAGLADRTTLPELARLPLIAAALRDAAALIDAEAASCGRNLREAA